MHPDVVRVCGLRRAVATAGLDTPGRPRLRFHDLRHTYASLLIAQGVDVAYVFRQLGHANITTTLNTYTRLFDHARNANGEPAAGGAVRHHPRRGRRRKQRAAAERRAATQPGHR